MFGRDFGRGQTFGGRSRVPQNCTHCNGTNHTVYSCLVLYSRLCAHQGTISEDDGHLLTEGSSSGPSVVLTSTTSSFTVTFAQRGFSYAGFAFPYSLGH